MKLVAAFCLAIGTLPEGVVACGGETAPLTLAPAPDSGAADAGPDLSPYDISCDAACQDAYLPVDWLPAPPPVLPPQQCECVPRSQLGCRFGYFNGHDCQCGICGSDLALTRVCIYDPYYGELTGVECVEP